MDQRCHDCPVLGKSLFHQMEDANFDRLCAVRSVHRYDAGAVVCSEGSALFGVYCIQSGTLKLTRTGERGETQIVRLLGPTGVFGLRPTLAGDNFAATATTLTECTVCLFPQDTIRQIVEDSPVFARAVIQHLTRALKMSDDLLMVLTQRPVRRRVADVLLLLNGHRVLGDDWEPMPQFQLKRKEIAQMVAATPETLSRVLAEFAESGLIRLSRKDLDILNPDGLQIVARD